MSIDEYRMLTDLLDAFDRLHDGMVEVTDVAALLFAASRALIAWPYAGNWWRSRRMCGTSRGPAIRPIVVAGR